MEVNLVIKNPIPIPNGAMIENMTIATITNFLAILEETSCIPVEKAMMLWAHIHHSIFFILSDAIGASFVQKNEKVLTKRKIKIIFDEVFQQWEVC